MAIDRLILSIHTLSGRFNINVCINHKLHHNDIHKLNYLKIKIDSYNGTLAIVVFFSQRLVF